MSEYAERRDGLLADILGPGFEGWQQSLVDEFVAECEQPAWLAAWGAEWRAQFATAAERKRCAAVCRRVAAGWTTLHAVAPHAAEMCADAIERQEGE